VSARSDLEVVRGWVCEGGSLRLVALLFGYGASQFSCAFCDRAGWVSEYWQLSCEVIIEYRIYRARWEVVVKYIAIAMRILLITV
jgi:hypothetical protein